MFGALIHEAGDGFRHDAPLLSPCPTLDQHFQIEPVRGETLQRGLAHGADVGLADVPEQALLKVGVTDIQARIID